MDTQVRNRMDVMRERVAISINPGNARPSLDAGSSIGGGGADTFSLEWTDESGNRRRWFKWGRHNFDDDTAIFY